MHARRLVLQNLRYQRAGLLAVALSVMAGTAALTGALLVGDSMRHSLRAAALRGLGRVEHALVSTRFVRTELADGLASPVPERETGTAGPAWDGPPDGDGAAPERSDAAARRPSWITAPIILLRGSLSHADTFAAAGSVQVLGVDERFAATGFASPERFALRGDEVLISESLARTVGARPGDEVLLRLPNSGRVSSEFLLGRRDAPFTTLRLTVTGELSDGEGGAFSLRPTSEPLTAWVALSALQRALERPARVNAILACAPLNASSTATGRSAAELNTWLRRCLSLADLDLRIRDAALPGWLSLESGELLLAPPAERAARAAASRLGRRFVGVLAYLANSIARLPDERRPEPASTTSAPQDEIPYSVVVGIDDPGDLARIEAPAGDLAPGEGLVNPWVADELRLRVGDRLQLTFFRAAELAELETGTASLRVAGIVPIRELAADRTLAPEYPGITDSARLSDWDPPFPMNLRRIEPRDEAYWETYRATPKVFLRLDQAQTYWAQHAERLGGLSAARVGPFHGDQAAARAALERTVLEHLDPAALDLRFEPVRSEALRSSGEATDFGSLFLGFSFFLIASSAALLALVWRLAVERRAAEIGLYAALGFTARQVALLLFAEAAVAALAGAALGLLAALGYAQVMLYGLQTWWAPAADAPTLELHVRAGTLGAGLAASVLLAFSAVALSLRGLARHTPRELLSGAVQGQAAAVQRQTRGAARWSIGAGLTLAAAALALLAQPGTHAAAMFFASGASALAAWLALVWAWLRDSSLRPLERSGWWSRTRLALRNLRRNPRRSLLIVSLMGSASFLVIAVGAFRLDPPQRADEPASPTGGFRLLATAAIPLLHSLETDAGQEALGLSAATSAALSSARVIAMRARDGDETSCRSPYRPHQPRIVAAPAALLERGGFAFSRTLANTPEERANPWLLLARPLEDGAIPAIADETSVVWQLRLDLGRDLEVTDERGTTARLRFVALLRNSTLQSEVVIRERDYTRLFPTRSGYSFFLIGAAPEAAPQLAAALERDLRDYGFDVIPALDRLRAYAAVQNTYLSAFQSLGGLGLVLGTVGLAGVVLRSLWERRAELALLEALGYSRAQLAALLWSEQAWLLLMGLAGGCGAALLAITPQLSRNGADLPFPQLGLVISAMLIVGLAASGLALAARRSLIGNLRRE
jgi:putative ABC transport system permease protein